MSQRERKDAAALLVAAAAILVVAGGRHLPELAGAGWAAVRPLAVTLAAATVTLAVVVVAARGIATRRGLRDRMRLAVVPTPSFDPPEEAVVRFASGLARSRRALGGLLDSPASAVRVEVATDADGRLGYALELPARARAAAIAAAGAYADVELRDTPRRTPTAAVDERGVEVARAELVLARASSEPLRAAGLDPDPLAAFAAAVSSLRCEQGDAATVCVDLLPVTAARRRRIQRRLLRRARTTHSNSPLDGLGEVVGDRRRGPAAAGELVQRRVDRQALSAKLGSPQPLFFIQVLVRVSSPVAGRAKATLAALLASFDGFAGDNHFRATGIRIPGIAFLGSDLPLRRRRFDRRTASGLFAPARRRLVSAGEIAGLLKPPTARCAAANVVRSIGSIPPAPARLPAFSGQRDLVPLGRVSTPDGDRLVGLALEDTFFSYMAGRSRWGKTETAVGQFIHLARTGHGCLFLDPHEDAIAKIKGYLTDDGLADRIVEINLADSDRQIGWNLFAVAGRSPAHGRRQVDAVVDAFASTLGWDEHNTRALNLTTQAAQALVDLARQLPAELAPTIFQIPTLLADDDWRTAALPLMSPATRRFFTDRFPRLADEAITPVTNLIDRLRAAPPVAALLGSPTASYDIAAAIEAGEIVLACPGSGSTRDRLVANFLVYDLLHAAKARAHLDPQRRRPFYAFLDEVQTYDGAASGNLAALLEQTAKYGLRAFLLNQNPERLTAATLNAVTTNRSHLVATALNAKAAGLIAREWGTQVKPEVLGQLERYTALASVTVGGEITAPFLVRGVAVDELHGAAAGPQAVGRLQATIDANSNRKPVEQTLAALDDHDQRILDQLTRHTHDQPTRHAIRRPR